MNGRNLRTKKKKKLHEQIKCRAIHKNVGDDEDEDVDDNSTQTETTRILKRKSLRYLL